MSSESRAVFLSYASQDADAARKICEALRGAGVEVWFDQSELRGGDAWDQKIRKQIKECALFIPVVSANTQSRREGYFRLEWKLADDRTHLMARGTPFLLPVCIDDTKDWDAIVPESFTIVQWVRLPGGETTAAFCERVKSLLGDGEAVGAALRRDSAEPSRRKAAPTRKPTNRWLVPAIAAVAAIVAVAFWQPWRKAPSSETKASAPPALSLSNGLTEARQLTLKARALIDDDLMAVRENFRLAEELCERAVKLAPDDGEAWATAARVSNEMLRRRYDTSTSRKAAARSQAERAIRLVPDSVEVGLAQVPFFYYTREWAELERRMRALHARAPTDGRVLLVLAQVLNDQDRDAEATEIRLNHPAFAGRDPRALLDEAQHRARKGRMAEMEALLDRAQALAPSREAYHAKLMLLVRDSHFMEAARLYVQKLPPQLLLEDAFASQVAQFWIRLGQGDKALEVLRRVARDFFEDAGQMLPKGYQAGWAQRLAGRNNAAEAEWREAISVVEKRLATEPNRPELLRWKAQLLALTGQKEAAEKTWKLYLELEGRPVGRVRWPDVEFYLASGRSEDAIGALQSMRTGGSLGPPNLVGWLRYEPWLEPIRNDPRVQEFIAEQDARLRERRQKAGIGSGPMPTAPDSPEQKSVAVLAFKNLSEDQGSDYFSDGISEELSNVLGRVTGLRVAGSTSAFSFKGKAVTVPEIARQLGVSHVVEGTVKRYGNRVRITAKLLNAADGFQVWASENLDREVKDSLALQDEIAGLIAKSLSLKLGVSSPAATAAVNPEAFRLYLEARDTWGQRDGRGDADTGSVKRIVDLLEQSIAIDPSFARAHATLAVIWSRDYDLAVGTHRPEADGIGVRARQAVQRALALDPTLAEAHTARARLLDGEGDVDGMNAAYRQAIALNPNYATAHHWYGFELYQQGKLREALAEIEIAVRLEPLAPIVASNYSSALRGARRWPEALAAADRALALRPNLGEALRVRVDALIELGRMAEARLAYQAVEDAGGSSSVTSRCDQIVRLARMGDKAAAEKLADALIAEAATAAPSALFRVYVALGRIEDGFAHLDRSRASAFGSRFRLEVALRPYFDRIRDDPRFVNKLGDEGILAQHREAWTQHLAWQKKTGGKIP